MLDTSRNVNPATDALRNEGQALWLTYLRRSLITSGELERLLQEDRLNGIQMVPRTLRRVVAGTDEYRDTLAVLHERGAATAQAAYRHIVLDDVQRAADKLKPLYRENSAEGLVSVPLPPHIGADADDLTEQARRWWNAIDRPNVLVEVPATDAGIEALEELISSGINVNATSIFSIRQYQQVTGGYLQGLERAEDPRDIVSVASFHLASLGRELDRVLRNQETTVDFSGLEAAIAYAKEVYQRFRDIFLGDRFAPFREKGAFVQRPLWADTGVTSSDSDTVYVESLVGPQTIAAVAPSTLDAFRAHGRVEGTALVEDLPKSQEIRAELHSAGIAPRTISERLLRDYQEERTVEFEHLRTTLDHELNRISEGHPVAKTYRLGALDEQVKDRLELMTENRLASRIWRKDPTVWGNEDTPELTNRLGWLMLPEIMDDHLPAIATFAKHARDEFSQVVLLGMGGSSLAPEVFSETLPSAGNFPELTVLDTTHPDAVHGLQSNIDLDQTLFVVSSKSGTTVETISLLQYFWKEVSDTVSNPGDHFVAVTDPESKLAKRGKDLDFRHVFLAPPDVGGRYSALTPFGLVPAALSGRDIQKLLDFGGIGAEASAFCVKAARNEGLILGAVLGEAAMDGRDKVTLITTQTLDAFPAWLEQLIAESTGKDGQGLIPVTGEPLREPGFYGSDRIFIHVTLDGEEDREAREKLQALENAGHPVIRFELDDPLELTREMFRWEMAVAVASAVMNVHPFNQPNVESAKRLARQAMSESKAYATSDRIDTIDLDDSDQVRTAIKNWLMQAPENGYISVQAYLAPDAQTTEALRSFADRLRSAVQLPVNLDYGPRFLHSTGQLHKGGPETGLFLQLVDHPNATVPVPDTDYSFNELISAQAIGDFQALRHEGRPVMRIRAATSTIDQLAAIIRELDITPGRNSA